MGPELYDMPTRVESREQLVHAPVPVMRRRGVHGGAGLALKTEALRSRGGQVRLGYGTCQARSSFPPFQFFPVFSPRRSPLQQ